MLTKTIPVGGVDTVLFGHDGDRYFANVETHIENSRSYRNALAALPRGCVIVDIGANIGAMAALARRLTDAAAIYCIEPSPRAFACLEAMIKANGFDNCHAIRTAVGAERGSAYLAEPDTLALSALSPTGQGVPVDVRTLDDIAMEIGIDRLDLLKIDVEGSELAVLKGGLATTRRHNPCVFLELNSIALSFSGMISPRSLTDFILAEWGAFYALRNGAVFTADSEGLARDVVFTNMTVRKSYEDITFGGSLPHASIHFMPPPPPPPPPPPLYRRALRRLRVAGRILVKGR
jgi:FkbM family methyltransferase